MSGAEVAAHYNAVKQEGIQLRTDSKIYFMRNLNNWVKSESINNVLNRMDYNTKRNLRVLDLACGKGGDLRKWNIARAKSVVMADIADVSINQAKGRYDEMTQKNRGRPPFDAQFIVSDCCKEDLRSKIDDPALFDIVSCQFALHYSFIDEQSARTFLKNATDSLKPGGYFIGTLPDAERIIWAVRNGEGEFGNAVCSVKYEEKEELSTKVPLFGAKFHFSLDSQVNCPEFLAYFPLLERLLDEFDLELVFNHKFPDAIKLWREQGERLMMKMSALKPCKRTDVDGDDEYEAAKAFIANLPDANDSTKVGSISRSEWEAICMYLVFAFRKRGGVVVEETRKREADDSEGVVAEKKPKLE